jgi:hypothetical protein
MDATMDHDNNRTSKQRHPAPQPGGWVDYVEARLDMLERTRKLRALRLRRQASARQGRDRPAKPNRERH